MRPPEHRSCAPAIRGRRRDDRGRRDGSRCRPLPDRVILRVVAAYAAAFVVFGFVVDGPGSGPARPRRHRPDARRAADRLFRRRRHRRGLRERRPAHAGRLPRLSRRRTRRSPARRSPACSWCWGSACSARTSSTSGRSSSASSCTRDSGARRSRPTSTPRSSAPRWPRSFPRSCSAPRWRSSSGCRWRSPRASSSASSWPGRGAAVQGAHGLQPVQHGLHRRHRGHAGRRHVQIVRVRSGPGDDLDDRQQPRSSAAFSRRCSRRWSRSASTSIARCRRG